MKWPLFENSASFNVSILIMNTDPWELEENLSAYNYSDKFLPSSSQGHFNLVSHVDPLTPLMPALISLCPPPVNPIIVSKQSP